MATKQAQIGQMPTSTLTASTGSSLAKAREVFVSAYNRVNHEIEVRGAIKKLQELDDQALRDIGIQRFDIERLARNGR